MRNLVHTLLATSIAFVAPRIDPAWFYTSLVLLVATFLWGRHHHFLSSFHDHRHVSYGEYFFLIGTATSYYFFVDITHAWYAAMLTLAFADPLAAFVGNRYGKLPYLVSNERRTVEGTVTCVVLATLIFIQVGVSPQWALAYGIAVGATENISLHGSDNLTIPLVAGLLALLAL